MSLVIEFRSDDTDPRLRADRLRRRLAMAFGQRSGNSLVRALSVSWRISMIFTTCCAGKNVPIKDKNYQ